MENQVLNSYDNDFIANVSISAPFANGEPSSCHSISTDDGNPISVDAVLVTIYYAKLDNVLVNNLYEGGNSVALVGSMVNASGDYIVVVYRIDNLVYQLSFSSIYGVVYEPCFIYSQMLVKIVG